MLEVINATRVRLFINSNSSSVFSLFMPTERVRSKERFDCISEFLFPTTPVAVALLCYLINHGIPFAKMSDDKDEIRT